MVKQNIDNVSFNMKETHDFSFLSKYGKVFCVFAQNDSGNISFGVDNGSQKYFIKVAGTKTMESCRNTEEAIEALKTAIPIYSDLTHPKLIHLVEHFEHNDLYAAVFKWAEGDCLFDYWNFEFYSNNAHITPPRERFKMLPREKKLNAFSSIFDFLLSVESSGYIAVDFYDGSIIYDFERDSVTICDIDFFRKKPLINDMGEAYWGTKRLKAPEEYILGADINTATNVFTLGALLMHFFGNYSDDEINEMYMRNAFFPCRYETWELNRHLYKIALKAVDKERLNRYDSIKSFYSDWRAAQPRS